MEELTKRADSRMYENKRLMKGKKIGWQKVKRMITGIVVALLLAVIVFQYMTIKIDKDKRHEAGHDKHWIMQSRASYAENERTAR